jgi:hypothetical protein
MKIDRKGKRSPTHSGGAANTGLKVLRGERFPRVNDGLGGFAGEEIEHYELGNKTRRTRQPAHNKK